MLACVPVTQKALERLSKPPPSWHGREQIRRSEQADYDAASLSISSTPVDAVQASDEWVYGIAHIEGTATNHADGMTTSFRATKTWLLQRQPSGGWLIARQMWNTR